ncbi:MAG: hypothetical protein JEZ03_05560 [Bacteroidales bacterium]|nr:hypothetical protein [Bacteroidales bacterium]
MDYLNKLNELYKKNNIYKAPLHSECKYSGLCWKNVAEERICKNTEEYAQLYVPYIGEKYDEARIMAIGINLHEYGGYNAQLELAKTARQQIANGRKRTFANSGYQGSLVWHRIVAYTTFILREFNHIETPVDRPYPLLHEVDKSFDYIAVTNSIKCSPWGERSKPTQKMWEHCYDFILKQEIRILQPKHLIVLGIENFSNIKGLFDKIEIEDDRYQAKLFKGVLDSMEILIYVFPHPTSSQGTSLKRLDDIEHLVYGYCNK